MLHVIFYSHKKDLTSQGTMPFLISQQLLDNDTPCLGKQKKIYIYNLYTHEYLWKIAGHYSCQAWEMDLQFPSFKWKDLMCDFHACKK